MKFFAFILAFTVLTLSVIPCTEGAESDCSHKTECADNNSGNHQDEQDHCSPFCTCNCCTHIVFYSLNFVDLKCNILSERYYPNYRTAYITTLFTSIWQPPKIS